MGSVRHRERYKRGKTDYGHRMKMLQRYAHTLRIKLSKKNRFYCSGFYTTEDPSLADRCYGYYQSRWLSLQGRKLRNNQEDLKVFGALVGSELNNKHIVHDFSNKTLILDLGRRKSIRYKSFLQGLLSTLDPLLKSNFRIGQALNSQLDLYQGPLPTFS